MKVKSKIHINYNGNWKKPGDVFEISDTDSNILKYVDVIETPKREPERRVDFETNEYESTQYASESSENPRRRGRPRRTDIE